jgi:hypothetical protein
MSDITSILSQNYATIGAMTPSPGNYVAVDPTKYTGTWEGTYSDGKTFKFQISNVQGFRAQVHYSSTDGTQNYSQVLIKNGQFRIGNSKFVLTGDGIAVGAQVVTNPYTGSSYLKKGDATKTT